MLSSRPSRVLRTQIGDVQGKTFDFGGHQASAFLGIPYAQPPIGELRFKKPLPARPWKGVRQCTQFGSNCPYRNPTHKLTSSEDCLFLNVFVPECSKEEEPPKDLPVMFYIHGGGFMLDSSTMLGCENIARYVCKKGVIVVTVNYRLGIFGFLSLDSKECPGNFGLWDMTLALQWAFVNIGAFGGDKQNITVFGQSAGAVAVDYLTLSPHSRDLFQKAMMFAGTSHCDFVNLHWDEYGREFALEFAKFHGFADNGAYSEDERNAALLVFYRKAKARDLALGIMPTPGFRFRSAHMIPLGPRYDGDFFPKSLEELRKEAPRKKIITGVTEYEGLLFSIGSLESNHHPLVQQAAIYFMRTVLTPTSFFGRHLFKRIMAKKGRKGHAKPPQETYKPLVTKLFLQMRPDLSNEKAEEIIDQFLDPALPDDEYVKRAVEIISDLMFVWGTYKLALERTKMGDDVWVYKFHYFKPGSIGLVTLLLPFEGPTHCCELPFFFGRSILGDFVPDAKDEEVIDKFTTYLTAFAKTGDPNNEQYPEKWQPVDAENAERFFLFDHHEHGMREKLSDGRLPQLEKIFEENPKKLRGQ